MARAQTSLPDEIEEQHETTRRKMLAAEAALLLLLRRRLRGAVADVPRGVPRARLAVWAPRLAAALEDVILPSRQAARRVALDRMRVELRALGAGHLADSLTPSGRLRDAVDQYRARQSASGVAQGILRRASVSGVDDAAAAVRAAAKREAWRLEMIASTEIPAAFNDERKLADRKSVV